MGRLVRKPRLPDTDLHFEGLEDVMQSGSQIETAAGDNYLERMVKYIPGEVIGFSMLINSILGQAMVSGGKTATMAGFPVTDIAVGAVIAACLLTPIFCWYVREDGDAWVLNAIVSTVAYPFWAYLMGAVAFADYRDGDLAVILVLTFTVVSGLISPLPRKPKAAKQREVAPQELGRLVEALA